ncbi:MULTISPECIES: hypothetical protein [unclassified Paenibacillus]|uniref:hypothetical protein n=1 Tax=unclassified Paenibacillus TaxID=185978 RepID=UPI001AE6F27E|nr:MULTISPECIES: hypothetical protein [unclassified Paenibacillus]MBP1157678.1 hypothetical protein [Paenibacillus sp. PvP091]MBP1171585.1 hypothetical protein [Paenibacillus sp. PvR098]MBP2437966.1 hypothetical protein [Paenibacillus sp. PvP052]
MEASGYTMRRKRSLDLGGRRNEPLHGINWGSVNKENENETKLVPLQAPERPTEIVEVKEHEDNKSRSPHFGDGYQKVTVYLPIELFDALKKQKKMRKIRSFSEAVSDALLRQLYGHSES